MEMLLSWVYRGVMTGIRAVCFNSYMRSQIAQRSTVIMPAARPFAKWRKRQVPKRTKRFIWRNASRMAGPKAFEAGVDPVPDLVIEIEVGNPVETALRASARLGVPEVWHLDATHDELELRVLRLEMDGASYTSVSGSGFLPVSSRDILQLLVPSLDEGAQNCAEHCRLGSIR